MPNGAEGVICRLQVAGCRLQVAGQMMTVTVTVMMMMIIIIIIESYKLYCVLFHTNLNLTCICYNNLEILLFLKFFP